MHRKSSAVLTVDVEDSRNGGDGVANLVERDGGWDSLQEDERSGLDCDRQWLVRVQVNAAETRTEGERAREDDAGDEERDERVDVESPRVVGEPDEETSADDSDVSELL